MDDLKTETISIIIPVHGAGENFRRCLRSIQKLEPLPNEIIVVADGESDGSWRLAEELGIRVIRLPQTGGPARARNIGSRVAKGDILFFVDADVTIPSDAVGRIVRAFEEDFGLAALFGSYDDTPAEANFLSQYRNLLHHYVHQAASERASTFWGACGAIRRDVFWGVGGFDESYRHPCIEDIELGYRVKKSGYNIRLLKELQVKHLKRWRFISLLKADFFYRAIPWSRLILSEKSMINDLNLKIGDRLSGMLVWTGFLTIFISFYTIWGYFLFLGIITILLMLNWDVYCFFIRKRGILFTLKVLPLHWFYYFYSTMAFGLVLIQSRLAKISRLFGTYSAVCS
jgi:GT2 family glycosyltransferase